MSKWKYLARKEFSLHYESAKKVWLIVFEIIAMHALKGPFRFFRPWMQ